MFNTLVTNYCFLNKYNIYCSPPLEISEFLNLEICHYPGFLTESLKQSPWKNSHGPKMYVMLLYTGKIIV